MRRQRPHLRRSKKGKKFVAGRGKSKKRRMKAQPCEITQSQRKSLMDEFREQIQMDVKKNGRAVIKDVGILTIKVKPARKARMGVNPFTKEKMMFKAKPKTKVIKFRAAKKMKEVIN
jgi:nucleoid DNA-binding protein